MPLYFGTVAPTCPLSTDSSTGPRQAHLFNRGIFTRPTIPHLPNERDLQSAIMVANIARSIVMSVAHNTVRNNVYPPKSQGRVSVAADKFKNTAARWSEQKDMRIKKKYKYYGTNDDGSKNKLTYAITERIERMVWYDKGWKAYLTWEAGDIPEGAEPIISGTDTASDLGGGE